VVKVVKKVNDDKYFDTEGVLSEEVRRVVVKIGGVGIGSTTRETGHEDWYVTV
jgi:hypothetical protein